MATRTEALGQAFTWKGRPFLKGTVPTGDNRGQSFTISQPLAGRYRIVRFFASGGMGLLLEGLDLKTRAPVLIKSTLRYNIIPYAKVGDRDGFTKQLLLPRKTLEMERRILVLLRNAGCNAVPHPNDFIYDANPQLQGPYTTEEHGTWTYDDAAMIDHEPYLIMEYVPGESLELVLKKAPNHRFSEARALRIFIQVADVLHTLHQPKTIKAGMIWQMIYQDLKPANLLLSVQDRVTVLDLGGCQLQNLATKQKLLPGAATAGYCPPECERPYELLTPAADIYTLGSNLFQVLSGRSPLEFFGGLATPQPRSAHLDVGLLAGKCRRATMEIIQTCLHPDPTQRYPDAEMLRQDLAKVLQDVNRI